MAIDLSDLALSVIILGIVTTIGASVLVNVRDSQLTNLVTITTGNETITGATIMSLAEPLMTSVTCVANATGVGGVLPEGGTGSGANCLNSGNYTLTASGGVDNTYAFGLKATSTFLTKGVNVTYKAYDNSDVRFTLPDNASTGIGEYGNWYKTIVIVGVAAVILGLIFMAFGRGARSIEASAPAY